MPLDRTANMSPTQLELCKIAVQATAQITASMITVSNEKNPAKISEAFKVVYKSVWDTIKSV